MLEPEQRTELERLERPYLRLSPSNQRLVRELIMKLQPSSETATYLNGFTPQLTVPEWISHLEGEGKSRCTLHNYTFFLNYLLRQFPQPTAGHIDAHLAECRATGRSASTINCKVSSFKSFFAFCMEKGYIASDPAVHLQSVKRAVRERKCPPQSDIKRLLSLDLTTRDRALLSLFIDGGLRLEEARTVQVGDIGEGEVTVIGKGNKQRTVPLSSWAMAAILRLKEQLPEGEKYLFPGRFPGQPWHWRSIEERLDFLCKEAGIERFTPHQLRHYFATEMLNDGANLNAVSQLLGHSSPATTANTYWHVDAGQRREQHKLHGPLQKLQRRRKMWLC